MKNQKSKLFVEWKLLLQCNFNCPYCYYPPERRAQEDNSKRDINKIVKSFNQTKSKWTISMGGGEPFLYPNFIELCEKLTKKHDLIISTNLSTNNIYDFAEKINPKKISAILCSLHITERKRLNLVQDFIKKIKYLKKLRFKVHVSQVMFPPIIKDLEKIFNYFRKQDIIIWPKNFNGNYKRKYYPPAYTKKEKEKIYHYINQANQIYKEKKIDKQNLFFDDDEKFLGKILSFKGNLCNAGKDFIYINKNGEITRCSNEKKILGNLFENNLKLLDKPMTCTTLVCNCPYYGLIYSHKNGRELNKKEIKNSPLKYGVLENYIYPITTPILKPIRKILKIKK